mgnify:CR=1 FL=1
MRVKARERGKKKEIENQRKRVYESVCETGKELGSVRACR